MSYGVPSYIKYPSHSIIILSNKFNIFCEGAWIVDIIVIFLFFNFWIVFIISNAVVLSNPVVGSSKNNKLGFCISSIPMLTLFFYPPEIPLIKLFPTTVSAQSYKPKTSTISSTYSYISSLVLTCSPVFRLKEL